VAPVGPVDPVDPVAPVGPTGKTKFKVCVGDVPVIDALAEPLVTVPIVKVFAGPVGPVVPEE
jgi:hypothetical protein